jgi:hypothetical protein
MKNEVYQDRGGIEKVPVLIAMDVTEEGTKPIL